MAHHSAQGNFSIRDRTGRLVLGHGSGGFTPPVDVPGPLPGELYDMRNDPGETRDLYRERPDVVALHFVIGKASERAPQPPGAAELPESRPRNQGRAALGPPIPMTDPLVWIASLQMP